METQGNTIGEDINFGEISNFDVIASYRKSELHKYRAGNPQIYEIADFTDEYISGAYT
jgi:hypothetical protein